MSTPEFQQHLVGLRQQIFWFAMSLTHDRDTAQDLVQESILRALVHREQFRENSNLKAWLLTIVRNTFINGHRREKRTVDILDRVQQERMRTSRSESAASSEACIRMSEIQRALGHLEDMFREPFQMHHDGYKYQEIANTLEIPVGTVKSRIHQARHRLMGLLSEPGAA